MNTNEIKLESLKQQVESLWILISMSNNPEQVRQKYAEVYIQYSKLKAWNDALK